MIGQSLEIVAFMIDLVTGELLPKSITRFIIPSADWLIGQVQVSPVLQFYRKSTTLEAPLPNWYAD